MHDMNEKIGFSVPGATFGFKTLFKGVPNDELVGKYLHSKNATHGLGIGKAKNLCQIPPTAKTQQYSAFSKLFVVEENLVKLREKAISQIKFLEEQWIELNTKEELFKENVASFNSFILDNETKRRRAVVKFVENQNLVKERIKMHIDMKLKLDYLRGVKTNMDQQIQRHYFYEEFLISCLDPLEQFRTIQDIILRFEVLSEVREELAQRQEDELTMLEHARGNTVKIAEKYTTEILHLSSALSNMGQRFETANRVCSMWEHVVESIILECIGLDRNLVRVKDAIQQVYLYLYNRMEKDKEVETNPKEKVTVPETNEEKLIFIKKILAQLKNVNDRFQREKVRKRGKKLASQIIADHGQHADTKILNALTAMGVKKPHSVYPVSSRSASSSPPTSITR